MPHRTLADFLEELGRAGELAPVDAEVDPRLEVAEITRRVARRAGPALLFRSVKGHDIPLVTNLLASESRICSALGVEAIEEATGRIDRILNSSGPEGWLERLRFGSQGSAVGNLAASRVKSGACQQIVRLGEDIHLDELPCLQVGEEVERLSIPFATILSAWPDSHAQLFLQGDLQISDRDRLTVVWHELASAAPLIQEYAARLARLPVAVVIGGDPAVHLAAAAPMPSAVDPLGLAGLLREKPLDAVPCRSVDLQTPAESDIVIEGYIDPTDAEACTAPRLSLAGYVLGEQTGRTIHVTAVTHRANRVFPAVVPGIDCNEICVRDRTMARIFLPFLKLRLPELVDFDLPLAGGARHVAFLALRKSYSGQVRRVAAVAWGMRPFCFARLLVIVDEDVEVRDANQVWRTIADNAHMALDVWLHAAPSDPIDTTSDGNEPSQKMVIDATRKRTGEGRASIPRQVLLDQEVQKLVTDRWAEYGLGPE